MPNFKSVVHFLLVDFGEGCYFLTYLLTSCDGGKTKSTPSPTDLDCTVRLDWSLTKCCFQIGKGKDEPIFGIIIIFKELLFLL